MRTGMIRVALLNTAMVIDDDIQVRWPPDWMIRLVKGSTAHSHSPLLVPPPSADNDWTLDLTAYFMSLGGATELQAEASHRSPCR
jgi:hypothetical protein